MARLVDRAAVAGGALALSVVALLVILWHYRPASSTRRSFVAALLGAAAGWAVGASTVRFLYLADPEFAEYAGERGADWGA
jgi:uncharacterized membrane protein YfcA